MAWCKAFDPITEPAMAPGPARILPPRARANPSRARPLGAFCTNDFHPRTNEPSPSAANRISARTNSHPCTSEPERRPEPAEMHERTPPRHARTQATRAAPVGPSERMPEMHVQTQAARCRRPYPPPRTTRRTTPAPPHERPPRAPIRTRATPHTPLPARRHPPTTFPRTHTRGPPCPSALAPLGLPSWRDPCSTIRQSA